MRQFSFAGLMAILAAALFLTACQSGPAPVTGGEIVSQREAVEYRLGNGDQLRVGIFGEPTLSGDFEVDGTGTIQMPLIGTLNVLGMTVPELQSAIAARYRSGQFLLNPQVTAEVTNYRPFYMLGEVNRPAEYQFSSGLTVMNAVAAAGGFTYRAKRDVVYIRSEGDVQERGVELTSTTTVRPGDTIRIGERLF
ncbi:MAG: polysaccharide biosynthesis/export family protein [Pseudomonadota bacterium]